jgi:hypothetical protein
VWREVAVIAILIVGVCCFALTPAMYLMFRALQWERAVRVVEALFPPALLLFAIAALLTYRRHKARRAMAQDDTPPSAGAA